MGWAGMAKVGIIDIGSNSVLLLIAEINEKKIKPLHQEYAITRIAEGLFTTGEISERALKRTLTAVKQMVQNCKNLNAEIRIFITEPLRIAKNAEYVNQQFVSEVGVPIQVLSQKEEALFAYLGATYAISNKDEHSNLVVDLGGASTELVLGQKEKIVQWKSLPLGAVKITDEYNLRDPKSSASLDLIFQKVKEEYQKGIFALNQEMAVEAIFIGGTITTLASIDLSLEKYQEELVDGHQFSFERIKEMLYFLGEKDTSERFTIKGMERGREDVIVGGIIGILAIMDIYGLPGIKVSTKGPRHGAIVWYYLKNRSIV